MKKAIKILTPIIVLIIVFLFVKKFVITDYKNKETGNNKNIQEIEQYILNVSTYKAKVKVTVSSNKNADFYEFEQEVRGQSYTKQLATSPEAISGMQLTYENGVLRIENTRYNLSKIYEDYPYITTNSLFLTSFIEGYRNSGISQIYEEDNKVKMIYDSKINKYNYKQILYINKASLEPQNLQVYDINNALKVDIIYNEIELNI